MIIPGPFDQPRSPPRIVPIDEPESRGLFATAMLGLVPVVIIIAVLVLL